MSRLQMTVNGTMVDLDVPESRFLSEVLREDLGLTGTKIGCNEAECGICTVLVNGTPVVSCSYPAFKASGADDFLSTNNATWVWTGSGTDNITLTEASVAELTSVDVTDQSVTFSFEVNPSIGGGRVTGIDGSYRVKLQ